jgi:ABC-2 type transport system ATP-binding protein
MNNVVEVRGLTKHYGEFTLENVAFDVPEGYITGFIGPNGAGKTTTIKLILGIVRGDSGSIKVFGEEAAAAQNGQVGVVTDASFYVSDWTVTDVEKAVAPFYPDWDAAKFAGYLKQFGLSRRKKIKELSRGMSIKLQLAAALSHSAKLLILDEPTSGLDPAARDEICDLLREFVSDEGHSVLFSTHITSDLEKIADYITFILGGHIVFAGPKDDFLEQYVRVAGDPRELSGGQRELILGYREHSAGFEGMAKAADAVRLPQTLLTENISLDEIIIFMNREEKYNG